MPTRAERERDCYEELVRMGGRPIYPIERLEEIAGNPRAHLDFLNPWFDKRHDDHHGFGDLKVIEPQLKDWCIFRIWQRHFREGFNARKENGDLLKRFVNPLRKSFMRDFQIQDAGFDGYSEAIKKLLAEYGFTRPFRLEEDQEKQDKLTEWIEYLGFQHALYDKDSRTLKLLQPSVDEAWKELVDSQILAPHHTKESILSYESDHEDAKLDRRAMDAYKEATLRVKALTGSADPDAPDPDVSPEVLRQIQTARKELSEAREESSRHLTLSCRILRFLCSVSEYREALWNLPMQKARLEWFFNQLPLIEAEMEASAVAPTEPPIAGSEKKRGAHDDDSVTTHEQSPKRQRQNSEEPSSASDLKANTGEDHEEEIPGSSRKTGQESSPAPALNSPLGASIDQSHHAKTHSAEHSRRTAASRKLTKGRVAQPSVSLDILDTPSYMAPRAPGQPRRSRRLAGKAPEHGLLPWHDILRRQRGAGKTHRR